MSGLGRPDAARTGTLARDRPDSIDPFTGEPYAGSGGTRFGVLLLAATVFVGVGLALRVALFVRSWVDAQRMPGVLGTGLLATFRITLFDGGRSLWLEDMPPEALEPPPPIAAPPDLDLPVEEYEDEEEEAPKPASGKGAPKPRAPSSVNAAPKKP